MQESRPADSVLPFTRSTIRFLFQIPISCRVLRVDSLEDTLSQMLGPPWIPTKLSAETKSRPFEGPVITVDFLANLNVERGRDIDKERRGGDSKGETEREREREKERKRERKREREREREREKLNDCYVLRVHRCRAWAPRMNRAIAARPQNCRPFLSLCQQRGNATPMDCPRAWGIPRILLRIRITKPALKVIFLLWVCSASSAVLLAGMRN